MKKLTKLFFLFFFSLTTLLVYAIPLNIQSTNWYNQYLPNLNNRPLCDITFVDSLLGFAVTGDNTVGDTNYIIKTTNGGNNWFKLDSVYGDISRIIFINTNTGFICGGWRPGIPGGFVSKTINSGINWNILPASIFANHFDDMFILNKDTMYVVDDNGFNGGVFRSTDGGNNWLLIYSGGFSVLPQKIYMYDKNMGFFSTGDVFGFLYRTTNGGFNWTKIGDEVGFSQITFIDSLTGWKAGGMGNLMKKSTNGGISWVNQPLPLSYIGGIYHFSILNKDTIWGVGSSYQYPNLSRRGVIYQTTNGGNNWFCQIPDTTLITNMGYTFIQFINKKIGWAYADIKGIHTVNGGDTTFLSISKISSEIPSNYKLFQNYPNPFNPLTNIKYQIKNNSFVILKVYDLLGKEITTLVNKKQSSGEYEVKFEGVNLSSGIYFYSLLFDGNRMGTKKMILLK